MSALSGSPRQRSVFEFAPSGAIESTSNPMWKKTLPLTSSVSSRGLTGSHDVDYDGGRGAGAVGGVKLLSSSPAAAQPPRHHWRLYAGLAVGALALLALSLATACGVGACRTAPPFIASPLPPPQIVVVSGVVLDSGNEAPLPGLPVSSTLQSTVTDANGTYSLSAPVVNSVAVFDVNTCDTASAAACRANYTPNTAAVTVKAHLPSFYKIVYLSPLTSTAFTPLQGLNLTVAPGISMVLPGIPDGSNELHTLLLAVVPPRASPGTMQADAPGAVTNSTALQSRFMVYVGMRVGEAGGAPFTLPIGAVGPTFTISNYSTFFTTDLGVGGADALDWWSMNTTTALWTSATAPAGGRRLATSSADLVAQAAGFWNSDRVSGAGRRTARRMALVCGAPIALAGNFTAASVLYVQHVHLDERPVD